MFGRYMRERPVGKILDRPSANEASKSRLVFGPESFAVDIFFWAGNALVADHSICHVRNISRGLKAATVQ